MTQTIISPNYATLADWAKMRDPSGKMAVVVELLSQSNEILDDMLVREANQATSHKTTVRTGLAAATWRALYQGVAPTKGTVAQITDTLGMLEAFGITDKALADLEGDTAQFRLEESMPHLEGMSQQMAQAVIYSNALATPQQIMGFAPRYNTVSTATAQTANNVIDAGGTGSTNTSIWLGVWGPQTAHVTFPKGGMAGLNHRDLGDTYAPGRDASNNPFIAYYDHYKWDLGLTVRDWRYWARIANIDVTLLSGGSAPNLINALIRAAKRIPTLPSRAGSVQKTDAPNGGQMSMGNAAIYVNRTVGTYLELQALNKPNLLLRFEEWDGYPVTTFRGIPIRTVDQILNTEARVV